MGMNNKRLGTAFEKFVCEDLFKKGYWVHFITPDRRGSQPFDIIAVKDRTALAVECKTLNEGEHYFPLSRLEENQVMAFQKWMDCGNNPPVIAVQWRDKCRYIPYTVLVEKGKVDLDDASSYC